MYETGVSLRVHGFSHLIIKMFSPRNEGTKDLVLPLVSITKQCYDAFFACIRK